jgi:diguanylate cyclase (GGDEF)-like protein
MATIHCLPPEKLERFLERRRATQQYPLEMSLAENLVEVLRKANEFVPSSAGSILLDDPLKKHPDRGQNQLTFIAAFGDKADDVVDRQIMAHQGIAGHVYVTGEAYYSADVRKDEFFYPGVDKDTKYCTESLVAIPIRIEKDVCGVLELINRQGAPEYSAHDRDLLAIFAGYISVSIQNVLDGRQAQEIAKRDNLTGLYNDRYLHVAMDLAIRDSLHRDVDLAVLFLDLDYFKRVNDAHGHLAGSQVLREVGMLLRQQASKPGHVVARYGGDEFVITLPATSADEAVNLAEELREEIVQNVFCHHPGEIQAEPLHLRGLTCSIGVATLHRHLPRGLTPEEIKSYLLRLADTAMYVAKETGRNKTAVAAEPVEMLARRPRSPSRGA